MIIKLILFLAFILSIILGAHFIFYRTVISFFSITHATVKSLLSVSIFFLALSFMASFFLLRWQENGFSVALYIFSATWTGVFINLLMAAAVSWVIIAILKLTKFPTHVRIVAVCCFILALMVSTYGVWNTFHPRVKQIDVKMKNLPAQWKNKIIVQLSDVHLGHIYGPGFLNSLINKVNTIRPDIIFITGDLFDGMISDFMHFAKPLDRLNAPKGIFFVTGNHETYVGLNRALNVLKQTKMRILHNEMIEIEGLQIIGISYPGIEKRSDIRGLDKLMQTPSNKNPRILLFHTPTNILPIRKDENDYHFSTYWVPDTSFKFQKRLGVNLQLSGHSHAGQIFPFGFLTQLIYKGYDYGLRQDGGFYIYTTSGVGTWGPPMRTGNSPEIVVVHLKQ